MVDRRQATDAANGSEPPFGPGIPWYPGDEDYPFLAQPGESAVDYFERWLREAPYASIERQGVRYLHETDVTNVLNHITADVSLLRARLAEFGDHVLTAADRKTTIHRIDEAMTRLTEALAALDQHGDQQG